MRCYRCHEDMVKSELEGVLVDRCHNKDCRGIWLDKGELEMLLYGERKAKLQLMAELKVERANENGVAVLAGTICPKCNADAVVKIERGGVELDHCTGCGGLFFDYGELQTILKDEKKSLKVFINKILTKIKVKK